ncbi:MAG: hypothetical protein WCU90_04285 [Kiritimatiellia bacterium]
MELYAGWSWLPYGYGWHCPNRYPYAAAGRPWQPHAGILFLLDGHDLEARGIRAVTNAPAHSPNT